MASIALKFAEYDTHFHPRAVSNAQNFYEHEILDIDIDPGVETIIKRLGTGKPKKIIRENRYGKVLVSFRIWSNDTLKKLQNLKALADDEGRLIVFPAYISNSNLYRVVMLPDEAILDNLLIAGRYADKNINLEFIEIEHDFPLRQVLFRTVEGNNLDSTTDGTQLKIVQIDTGNSLIRLNKIPNVASIFEPESGNEWCLESVDDTDGAADPARTGDYTHHLKIVQHATYTKEYLYAERWVKVETVGRGALNDFSINEKVALYNPFISQFNAQRWQDHIVEKSSTTGWRDLYVSAGGAFKHTDGDFVLIINGNQSGVGYSIGSFKGNNLNNLAVQNNDNAHFVPSGVASNWREDQLFSSSLPIWLPDKNKYIIHCSGYSGTDGKWRIGWVKFDEDFNDIEYAGSEIIDSAGSSAGMYAVSVVQYKGKYWMAFTDRGNSASPDTSPGWKLRYAIADEPDGTFTDQGEIAAGLSSNDGLWRGSHIDANAMFLWRGELYCLPGGTARYLASGVRANRVYGLFKYDEGEQDWVEDSRSPVLVNPMYGDQIWDSAYSWCNDHCGGYPIMFEDKLNRKLYLFLAITAGSNNYRVGYVDWDLQRI